MLKKVVPHFPRARGLLFLAGVLWSGPGPGLAQPLVTNTYTVATDDFANPERGFYYHTETRASAPSAVPSNLANLRVNGSRDPNNAYVARISLVLRVFYLDTFITAPISSNYLAVIEADLASIRQQGAKAIVRFAYFRSSERPFPEPSKARILEHIGQLAPLLRRNRDVMAVLQQGFIGAWGEGYYTDVFSTAGQAFTAQNWTDRAAVIQALLDALPPERMIQVRVPQQRQKFLHGPAAPTSTPAEAAAQAFNGSAAARIGFHNDCFLADATDAGTFVDYDGATEPLDVTRLRDYQALETRYTAMGGETCLENSPADNCAANGGRADGDLALFHYSFLNQGYNANVNDDWVTQGCMEDIKRRLGYRLELISGIFPGEAHPGQVIPLRLELRNIGFAAPFNPRGLELLLRHTNNGQRYFAELSRDIDARRWLPGTNHVVAAQLLVPSNLPAGPYELLLHLPDPAPSLYGLAHYSIRLANSTALDSSGVSLGSLWEPATGYHRLGHTLVIDGPATNAALAGTEIPVLPYSAVREAYDTWRARNFLPDSAEGEPEEDPDADGWQNLFEYAVGTDPHLPTGAPALASFENGRLILTIHKPPGVKDVAYEVEGSPNLAPDNWSPAAVSVLTNSATLLQARLDTAGTIGFLRLRVRFLSP
jgi:hypothetical protein